MTLTTSRAYPAPAGRASRASPGRRPTAAGSARTRRAGRAPPGTAPRRSGARHRAGTRSSGCRLAPDFVCQDAGSRPAAGVSSTIWQTKSGGGGWGRGAAGRREQLADGPEVTGGGCLVDSGAILGLRLRRTQPRRVVAGPTSVAAGAGSESSGSQSSTADPSSGSTTPARSSEPSTWTARSTSAARRPALLVVVEQEGVQRRLLPLPLVEDVEHHRVVDPHLRRQRLRLGHRPAARRWPRCRRARPRAACGARPCGASSGRHPPWRGPSRSRRRARAPARRRSRPCRSPPGPRARRSGGTRAPAAPAACARRTSSAR